MPLVSQKGAMRTLSYGQSRDQVGDLYLPDVPSPPVICLVHGGFWRVMYGRSYIAPVALDLVGRGFAVWSLEYRRVGAAGGGWPGTLDDVGAGIDRLATLVEEGIDLDLARVATVGHSAGGQLALWCAKRGEFGAANASQRVRIAAAVGLAPVADLARAYELGCGNGAVAKFLGGSPGEQPERYRMSSPMEMLPLGVRQLIIHGSGDEDVPIEISRSYADAATAAGDDIRLVELANAGHMGVVDTQGEALDILSEWLQA
jgi:acetyl esterase/lipase